LGAFSGFHYSLFLAAAAPPPKKSSNTPFNPGRNISPKCLLLQKEKACRITWNLILKYSPFSPGTKSSWQNS
jgi:hypothetical protein